MIEIGSYLTVGFIGIVFGIMIMFFYKSGSSKCLHCDEGIGEYCEDCYQHLVARNLELISENYELKNKLLDKIDEGKLTSKQMKEMIENIKYIKRNTHITQIDQNIKEE